MQTKSAKSFQWRVYSPPAVTSFVAFLMMLRISEANGWWWAAGFGAALIAAVAATIWQMNNFHCPDCKQHIPTSVNTAGRSGVPINFYCSRCDVLWEAGLSMGDD